MTFVRNHILSLAIVFVLTGLAMAQDPLEQARQAAILKAQKLEAEIKVNFQDADLLKRTNPEAARDRLRKIQLLLEENVDTLPQAKRTAYLDEASRKINQITAGAVVARKADEQALEKAKLVDAFKAKLAADNAKAQFAQGPSVQIAMAQQTYRAQQMALVNRDKQQQTNQLQQQLYYKTPVNPLAVPERDIRIMKALDSYLNVDLKQQPMKEVFDYLELKTQGDLSFILDVQGLKEFRIEDPEALFNNEPITKKYKKMKVRTLMHLILGERGMAYYLEDGNVFLTKDAKIAKKLIVRMYPCANLVGGQAFIDQAVSELGMYNPPQGGGNRPGMNPGMQPPGPAVDPDAKLVFGPKGKVLNLNVDGLMNQIRGTIEPDHWQGGEGGGPASMLFIPAAGALQIRCSLEVHYLIMASGILKNN